MIPLKVAKRLPLIVAEIDRITINPTQEELEPLRVMLEKLWHGLNGRKLPPKEKA